MRLKIKGKLLLLTIFLIIFSFTVQIIFNRLFLDKYYQMKRRQQIVRIADDLTLNDYTSDEINEITNRNSVTIEFLSLKSLNRVEENFTFQKVDGIIKGTVSKKVEKLEENFFYASEHLGAKFLTYYRKKGDAGYIRIKANMEEMNQSIAITNNFMFYSAMIAFLFGILLSIMFSKFFLEPIYKINSKIKKLAKLDFDEKLVLNTHDEFQELSENINFVSNELENKLQDLKIANIKLKEDIDKEKYFEQKRREFISSVTHEIKTPITVISTYAESLAEGYVNTEERRKDYAHIIMDEGENITKLVDDLLKILKNEYDAGELNKENFDLIEVLETELIKFKIDLEKKKVRYDICSYEKNIQVYADKEKITHVINNLLSNAVSYVNEEGELTVSILNENENCLVEVENSGKNIAEENLEEIWKPFFKEDKSRNRKYGGTGLGLSIVSETLKNHEQRFGVVNTSTGVKFWFELKKVD